MLIHGRQSKKRIIILNQEVIRGLFRMVFPKTVLDTFLWESIICKICDKSRERSIKTHLGQIWAILESWRRIILKFISDFSCRIEIYKDNGVNLNVK